MPTPVCNVCYHHAMTACVVNVWVAIGVSRSSLWQPTCWMYLLILQWRICWTREVPNGTMTLNNYGVWSVISGAKSLNHTISIPYPVYCVCPTSRSREGCMRMFNGIIWKMTRPIVETWTPNKLSEQKRLPVYSVRFSIQGVHLALLEAIHLWIFGSGSKAVIRSAQVSKPLY